MSIFSVSPILPSPEQPFVAEGLDYIGYMDPGVMHSERYNDRTYPLQMVLKMIVDGQEFPWQEKLAPHAHLLGVLETIRDAYLADDAETNAELTATVKIGPYMPTSSARRRHQDKGMIASERLYFASAPFSTNIDGHGELVPGAIARLPGDTWHWSPSFETYQNQPRTLIRAAAVNY